MTKALSQIEYSDLKQVYANLKNINCFEIKVLF